MSELDGQTFCSITINKFVLCAVRLCSAARSGAHAYMQTFVMRGDRFWKCIVFLKLVAFSGALVSELDGRTFCFIALNERIIDPSTHRPINLLAPAQRCARSD